MLDLHDDDFLQTFHIQKYYPSIFAESFARYAFPGSSPIYHLEGIHLMLLIDHSKLL